MIHPGHCTCDAYACQLRRKGIGFSSEITPTMRARRPWRPHTKPSWEAGVAGERRVDGSFMPYLDGGRQIPIKEYGERRRKLSDVRTRQVSGPPPEQE
jgi:hypothetical protein